MGEPMTLLRWAGIIIGAVLVFSAFRRFNRGFLRRGDFLLTLGIAGSLILLGFDPDALDALRDLLKLEGNSFSRLIGLLVLSGLASWVLIVRGQYHISLQRTQFDRLIRALVVMAFKQRYGETIQQADIAVVIPAYNEAENIGPTLEQMPRTIQGLQVVPVVIDDCSQDDTATVARAHGAVCLSQPINRGGGAAIRCGFDIARALHATYVVTMDADGQHLPEEIATLLDPLLEGRGDIVIGSRLLGSWERESSVRVAGLHLFNFVINLLTPTKITDCSSGFRAFVLNKLATLQLKQDQYHTSELIIEAGKRGVRIVEVPITIRKRASGTTKKGGVFTYGLNFAKALVGTWFR
ncbi:MAG: glycosyltransferase [Magnetococcales bacterium]|nr:glycosyltransferase [Magnetococcales bacterium]